MIYLDNAATTLFKPQQVKNAVAAAMDNCANPGRSGHRPAMTAAKVVFNCRETAAEFFGLQEPERVVFTQNATHALNIAIKSALHGGGHAVITGYEHNSVVRPLEAMRRLQERFPHAVHLEWKPAGGRATAELRYSEAVRGRDDAELADGFVADCRGAAPTDSERALLAEALRAVQSAEVRR